MFRRIAAVALVCILAAILLVAAWPQLFGVQFRPLFAQFVSLRAAGAAAATAFIVMLLLLMLLLPPFRRLGGAFVVLLLVFVAANGAVLGSRGLGNTSFEAAGTGDLTVLSWNTLGDAPGAERIAALALEVGADIVALPETTEQVSIEVAMIMKSAGSPMWVNHVSFDKISKARTTSLLTSAELGTYSVDNSRGNTSVVPSVIAVPDNGSGPTIIAAHPVAPIPGYLDHWQADLRWLADVCAGENVILAGDLNSTIDHYAGLANDPASTLGDCTDAAAATGNAAVGTWPTRIPALLGSPIDHVMATDEWRATGVRVIQNLDQAGSDHRPIVAQLSPAN